MGNNIKKKSRYILVKASPDVFKYKWVIIIEMYTIRKGNQASFYGQLHLKAILTALQAHVEDAAASMVQNGFHGGDPSNVNSIIH